MTVYTQGENPDHQWPCDIIPRTIMYPEWQQIERGLVRRLTALNLFINDVYNECRIGSLNHLFVGSPRAVAPDRCRYLQSTGRAGSPVGV